MAWARIVRIYPALVVAVLFCAYPVGLAFTSLPSGAFLSDSETWRFVGIHRTLLAKWVVDGLPGVFEQTPYYPGAVNGSLWTLPWELRMDALLGAVGLLAWILARGPRPSELRARCIGLGVIGCALFFTLLHFRHLWTDRGAYDRWALTRRRQGGVCARLRSPD